MPEVRERYVAHVSSEQVAPTVVVGAGPAGLAAAFVVARAGVPVVLLDRSDRLGGKVRTVEDEVRRFEHGVHGWWPSYVNFDRLLRWADIDVDAALVAGSDIRIMVEDGRQLRLRPLDRDVPSPLSILVQAFRTPLLTFKDMRRLARFSIHLLAFDPVRDTAAYERIGFDDFLAYVGVTERAQKVLFGSFTKTFCYSTLDGVNAATALGALRSYILPSDRGCVPRWLTGLGDDVLFSAMRAKLTELGVTVVHGVTVHELELRDDDVGVVVSGLADPPDGVPIEDDSSLEVGSVPQADVDAAPLGLSVVVDGIPVLVRRRVDATYEAIVRSCTHAGCETTYRDEAFVCPCHGGTFDSSGEPKEGPPTRALDRLLVSAAAGTLSLSRATPRRRILAGNVVLATDPHATRDILAATAASPVELKHDLGHVSATSVLVIRLWFRDVPTDDKPQGVLTPLLPMVDAYFCLSRMTKDDPGLHVVEVQVAGVKEHYLELPDETLVALALEDLREVSEDYTAARVVDSRVQRHQDVFATFPVPEAPPIPVHPLKKIQVAGDWTGRPGNSWMMERAVVSGLDRGSHVLEHQGIAPVDVLDPPRGGLLLRLASLLAFLMRSIVKRGLDVPPTLTLQQMLNHDRIDHVINGWAGLAIGTCALLPVLDPQFDPLLTVWPCVLLAMNLYFFVHVEPWVRVTHGSWLRSLAEKHTFQHRIMTSGGTLVASVELGLALGWLEHDLWRALFPIGSVIFGVLFTLHHYGEDPLADRQHRDIGFLSMAIGVTMGAERFFEGAAGLAFVWPVLFICQAYFFITYMSSTLHGHAIGTEAGDGHAHGH